MINLAVGAAYCERSSSNTRLIMDVTRALCTARTEHAATSEAAAAAVD